MMHPLLPFSGDAERDASQLQKGWVGLAGDAPARQRVQELLRPLGTRIAVIDEDARPMYHAAAVFASNFPVVLAYLAQAIFRRAGIGLDDAASITRALVGAASENVANAEPSRVLTGPGVRADVDALVRQVQSLETIDQAVPHVVESYEALSRVALEIAKARGVDPGRIAAAEQALKTRK
jgi:predicted short-subunit dehydrogenase-like oxidoreductase (DUF2520 family)